MSHLRALVGAVTVIALLLVVPLASAADPQQRCRELETAAAIEAAAECWAEVRANEEAAAKVDAEIKEDQEREAAKEARRKERKEEARGPRETGGGLRRAPTVRRAEAEHQVYAALHENRNWRHRTWGYVDCEGGRVNRTHWRCQLGWVGSAYCFRGRAMVTGEWFNPNERNRPWFKTSWTARACY